MVDGGRSTRAGTTLRKIRLALQGTRLEGGALFEMLLTLLIFGAVLLPLTSLQLSQLQRLQRQQVRLLLNAELDCVLGELHYDFDRERIQWGALSIRRGEDKGDLLEREPGVKWQLRLQWLEAGDIDVLRLEASEAGITVIRHLPMVQPSGGTVASSGSW